MLYNGLMMPKEIVTCANPIKISGLVKRYRYQSVLDGVSITISKGDLCVLIGANGAGKTTLLRILAGLARPDKGECLLGGMPLATNPAQRRMLGYVGHQPMFYHDLTGFENLCHYARLYQLPNVNERVTTEIRSVGLIQSQHKPVRIYSRGMQQRLSIARALLHDPVILLFDEPYTGLDLEAARVLDERLRLLQRQERTILLAAHRPQRLINLATHIAWLREGKISHHIPVDRLSEAPELQAYLQETA
jgi:heme exporter protein A